MNDEALEKIKAVIREQETRQALAFFDQAAKHATGLAEGAEESVEWTRKILQAGIDNRDVWDGVPVVVVRAAISKYLEYVAQDRQSETPLISGATFDRLQRAIAAFPTRYPDHETKPPKLEVDVRSWLKEVDIVTSDREAHVFGTIIAEHFKL